MPEPDIRPRRFRGGKALIGGFLVLLLVLLVLRWAAALYVEHLWYVAEGAPRVFWTRTLWEWGARLLAGGVTAVLVWANLRVVASTFTGIQIRRRFGDLVIQEQLPRAYVRWGLWGGAVFTGLWFAAAVPAGTGLDALLLVYGPAVGEVDPVLGRDVGFYLFRFPVLSGMVTYGLVAVVFAGALTAAGYTATGAIRWGGGRVIVNRLPRQHLGLLAAVFIVLVGIRFALAPYALLLDGGSAVHGIFGYADEHARLTAYRMATFLSLFTAAVGAWFAARGRLLPVAAGGGALAIVVLGLVEVYPALVQRFEVQPNELARETSYIRQAIDHTRTGFGLAELRRARLEYTPPTPGDAPEIARRLDRLPVWTEGTLLATFRQIEARFEYYNFHEVAFDRYPSRESVEPVAVAVRELDPAEIPDPGWQNLHLRERFVRGMGAVSGRLNGQTVQGRLPMFLTAIPPELRSGPDVPDGLRLDRPQVFVGSRPQYYAVLSPTESAFLAPDGSRGVAGTDFPQGIPMGSLGRTIALAWHFQDLNLLFASEVTRDSRFVYRRDVRTRIEALAPFLHLPEEPYPVIHQGGLVWIVEGFTLSRSYPLSVAHPIGPRRSANYVRNAVKATVDAVTGEARIYAADPDDPMLRAWSAAFPGLVRDLDDMPEGLRRHLRYSRWLFEVQSEVLLRYHQSEPRVFHAQQDRWDRAQEIGIDLRPIPYRPEYAFLTLPGEDEETFALSTVFVPFGRQNLASLMAARWQPDTGGGEILLWDVPLEDLVPGPRQVEALVEQDPEISQQFSLWRQGGSQVWTGHLHLVPVGNTLIYMEPIFLSAEAEAIPEIRRYVLSDGRRVVMEPTLEGALAALLGGGVPDPDGVEPPGEGAPPVSRLPEAATIEGSREALELLEAAEARLRDGDWEGFGRALEALRAHLRRLSGG